MKNVHVGIVTYNSIEMLPLCLAALEQSTIDISISIFDNASSDGTAQWLQEHKPDIRLYIHDMNIGFGPAHNRIIQTIGSAHYFALNPDVIIAPDYIEHLVRCIETKNCAWVGGKLLHGNTKPPIIYSAGHAIKQDGYAFNIGYGRLDEGHYEHERAVFGVSGAAVLYSSILIEGMKHPFFDETMFLYYEDIDLDWRANKAGFHCYYCPQALAFHYHKAQTDEWLRAISVVHRWLSVVKNADTIHMLFYNIPLIGLHMLFRLLVNPRVGVRMMGKFFTDLSSAIQQRNSQPQVSINAWFVWSSKEISTQPRTLYERFWSFIRHLMPDLMDKLQNQKLKNHR